MSDPLVSEQAQMMAGPSDKREMRCLFSRSRRRDGKEGGGFPAFGASWVSGKKMHRIVPVILSATRH